MSKAFSSCANVAVGGPQAVGKTSALRALAQLRPEFDMIFFGEQLPDDFQDHTRAEKEHIRARAARRIASKLARRESVTVVDLHYIDLREPNPKIQQAEFLSCFDLMVFLNVSPEVLLERRTRDTIRKDRPMTLAHTRKDLGAHLKFFNELVRDGMAAALIESQGQPLDVAKELARHIDAGEPAAWASCARNNGIVDAR